MIIAYHTPQEGLLSDAYNLHLIGRCRALRAVVAATISTRVDASLSNCCTPASFCEHEDALDHVCMCVSESRVVVIVASWAIGQTQAVFIAAIVELFHGCLPTCP